MKIRISPKCPVSEISIGNSQVITRDQGWREAEETKELQEAIEEGYVESTERIEKKAEKAKEQGKKGQEVWVFAECAGNKVARVSLELLGKGRELADDLDAELAAILFVKKDDFSDELIAHGADKVYVKEHDFLDHYDTQVYSDLMEKATRLYSPQIILYGATHIGRDLAPRVARRIGTGLTADCTGLSITDKHELLQTRPAFGGNLMAEILCKNRPQMSTVRPGVMSVAVHKDKKGKIINLDIDVKENSKVRLIQSIKSVKKVINLEEAEIIVAGGRGLESKENFMRLVPALADILNAEIGASRAAVDSGWVEKPHQVGQTGKTVRPRVYLALGISGAIQHRAGMQNSDLVIAVNKDPSAEIFSVADYGFVADVNEFVPALIDELKCTTH